MSTISKSTSSSEGKEEKFFYTVRGKDISYHANKILNNVKETALSEIKWTDVIKGACYGADCLVVFETGSSNSNRALDILSGIRERDPSVLSIISVILCTNNSKDHDKVCSSIDNHTFRTEKDISFECLLFSDGGTHECSRNIGKSIESQLKEIQEKRRQRENNTSRVKPAIDKKIRSKLIGLLALKDKYNMKDLDDNIKDLEKVIQKFEEKKLEDKGDLTKAKDCLEERKLEKGLREAIYKRRRLDEAIENTEKSKFKEKFQTLLCEAKEALVDLKKQGKYTYSVSKLTPEIITELRGYKQPLQIIQDVVLAAFILLGEKKDTLKDWETIRYQMGPQGRPSLRQRVKDFEERKEMEISEDTKTEINGILHGHLLDNVRQVSSGAGTLYDWIRRYVPVEEHN